MATGGGHVCQFCLKTTKPPVFVSLPRFFDELFDVRNDDPFLTL